MRFKKVVLTLLGASAVSLSYSQSGQSSKVKVLFDQQHTYESLCRLGACTEGAVVSKSYIINDLSESEIRLIHDKGFSYSVLIDNVSEVYAKQNALSAPLFAKSPDNNCDAGRNERFKTPDNYKNGSMGGYFTYNEMLTHLDNMRAKFPNLVSAKSAIGVFMTAEGRPIYYLKITANADLPHLDRPRVLYTALHRANAPGSLSQLIFFMYYMLENYDTDPQVKSILDNTELYFIPCVNPDGYVYNCTTNPNGGGNWSKNRRVFYSGVFNDDKADSVGVDLLSNYSYNFNYDEWGSSGDITYRTYRGPSAFSEPETQAVNFLSALCNFSLVVNHRAPGNHIVIPWGYSNDKPNPNEQLTMFDNMASMLADNNYKRIGNNKALFNRPVNGTPEDWMLGVWNKPAFAPSMGTPGVYYSPEKEIISQCKDNLLLNMNAAKMCRKTARVSTDLPMLTSVPADATFIMVPYTLTNLGVDSVASFTVTLKAVPGSAITGMSGLSFPTSFTEYGETVSGTIMALINKADYKGLPVKYLLSVDNGSYKQEDTFQTYFVSVGHVESLRSCTAFDTNFNSVTAWGAETHVVKSAPESISDSPLGNYADNDINILELKKPIDLMYADPKQRATLSFYAYWNIEPDYDYAQVQASIDSGKNWFALCGKYTKPGSEFQDVGNPLYDGKNTSWVQEEIDLAPCVGHVTRIRFRMVSDVGISSDGIAIDDIRVNASESHTLSNKPLDADAASWMRAVPNPFADQTKIYYNLPSLSGTASLSVCDMMGRMVATYTISDASGSVNIDLSALPSGMYFCRINSGNIFVQVQKLINY